MAHFLKKFSNLELNFGLITTLLATIIFEIFFYVSYFNPETSRTTLHLFSESNTIRLMLMSLLAYFIIFPKRDHHKAFISLMRFGVPLLAGVILLVFLMDPTTVDNISVEDELIENMSAGLLGLGSFIALVGFFRLAFQKKLLLAAIMAGISLMLFILAMEEISWMQRILQIETWGIFHEYNRQEEINLHNFNTLLSENIYYVGAFVVLTALPFYRNRLEKVLSKLRLSHLSVFIPSAWLLIPFSITVGFMKSSSFFTSTFILLVYVLTILMLVHRISNRKDQEYKLDSKLAMLSILIIILSTLSFILYNYAHLGVREHFATEYRELFISIGLLAYATDTYYKLFPSKYRERTARK